MHTLKPSWQSLVSCLGGVSQSLALSKKLPKSLFNITAAHTNIMGFQLLNPKWAKPSLWDCEWITLAQWQSIAQMAQVQCPQVDSCPRSFCGNSFSEQPFKQPPFTICKHPKHFLRNDHSFSPLVRKSWNGETKRVVKSETWSVAVFPQKITWRERLEGRVNRTELTHLQNERRNTAVCFTRISHNDVHLGQKSTMVIQKLLDRCRPRLVQPNMHNKFVLTSWHLLMYLDHVFSQCNDRLRGLRSCTPGTLNVEQRRKHCTEQSQRHSANLPLLAHICKVLNIPDALAVFWRGLTAACFLFLSGVSKQWCIDPWMFRTIIEECIGWCGWVLQEHVEQCRFEKPREWSKTCQGYTVISSMQKMKFTV